VIVISGDASATASTALRAASVTSISLDPAAR